MDIDFEEEYVSSEDEDSELGKGPWQCGLSNVSERVIALHQNGSFTDITLTFPDTEITYDVHRLILAMSSPVFEGILYGPMRTEGPNVLLHDDDPEAMAYVLAHCYGNFLELPDMDTTLEVYKLADKYLLDSLRKYCCGLIATQMSSDNNNDVIEFAERYSFTHLKSDCPPFIKEIIKEAAKKYEHEPDNTSVFRMLMSLNDAWIEDLHSEVIFKVLDFQESWKYPEIPLEDSHLRTIISSSACSLDVFYGCINAELIYQFPLAHNHDPGPKESLKLNLSVTDLHHARRVIDAINQQNRFKNNVIAIHIRCEEVWPSDWSPIRPESTHRPSILFISDTDDDKASWVVEAAKALLPQCEGSIMKWLLRQNISDEIAEVEPGTILALPRSNFTPNGFINMLHELSSSGVKLCKIYIHSSHIGDAQKKRIHDSISILFDVNITCERDTDNLFRTII